MLFVNGSEVILVTAFFALTLLALVVAVCRTLLFRARVVVLSLWVAASVVVFWTASSYQKTRAHVDTIPERPVEMWEEGEEGYVSSRTCRACHPHNYVTWNASYHPRMTQLATPESVLGRFDGSELQIDSRRYRLERRGDEFWAEFDSPASEGKPRRIWRRVVLTTGSHHMQVYWYATGQGRNMGQLPIVYVNEVKRWVPRDSVFLKPPMAPQESETRRWAQVCIRCHTTAGKPGLDLHDASLDLTRVAEFGIACEACHGPAEEHVRHYRDPQERYRSHFSDEPGGSIVHPARLSHRRSSQICGNCHAVTMHHRHEEFMQWVENGFRYRPGDDLDETRLVVCEKNFSHPALQQHLQREPGALEAHFWSDGMIRISGREYNGLIESPCFQRGELSCLSCHVMHKLHDDPRPLKEWANDQLKPGMEGNRACLQCHDPFDDDNQLTAHTHHPPDSTGSKCYNCHMPHTTYGLLKAIHSHQIDSPTVQASLTTGRPNACNQCHLDKTLYWASQYLHEWYAIPKPEQLSADQQSVAASLLWLLKGDAGQRALAAWSMGWQPAKVASGENWIAPFLAPLLDDPYHAVRYIAYRSLRRLEGFRNFEYDFVGDPRERAAAARRVVEVFERMRAVAPLPHNPSILVDPQGGLLTDELVRLLRERDDKPMGLLE